LSISDDATAVPAQITKHDKMMQRKTRNSGIYNE
jgi:hypothetical protein